MNNQNNFGQNVQGINRNNTVPELNQVSYDNTPIQVTDNDFQNINQNVSTPVNTPNQGVSTPVNTPNQGVPTPVNIPNQGVPTLVNMPNQGVQNPVNIPIQNTTNSVNQVNQNSNQFNDTVSDMYVKMGPSEKNKPRYGRTEEEIKEQENDKSAKSGLMTLFILTAILLIFIIFMPQISELIVKIVSKIKNT